MSDAKVITGSTDKSYVIVKGIDLGSNTNRFRELFLSGNTISLDNLKLSCVPATGTLQIHDGSGTLKNIQSHNINANDITANNITTTGYIAGPAVFTIDPAAVGDNTGKVVIAGDLQVDGTTTTINSTTLAVDDKNIVLGDVATPSDVTAEGGGIKLFGGLTNKTITWGVANTAWTSSENFNIVTGKTYKINGTDVLSSTTLGSGVVSSSLTSVGTITSGTWNGTTIAIANGGTGSSSQNFVDLTTAQTIEGSKTFSSLNNTPKNVPTIGVK